MNNIHEKFSQAKIFLFHLIDPNHPISMLSGKIEAVIFKPREALPLPQKWPPQAPPAVVCR